MNCMKCGRETSEDDVFCQKCLLEMEKCPVLPGTVVLLPRRREVSPLKKVPKRHAPTIEEQVAFFRKCTIILSVLLLFCIVAIIIMFKPTMHYIRDEHFEIGQNYSSVVSTVVSSAPPSAE